MKLTAAIAGAYMPKQVMYNGELREVHGFTTDHVILFTTTDEFEYAEYSECQLLLTPLSKISDEDAVEVAKIIIDDEDNLSIIKVDRESSFCTKVLLKANKATYLDVLVFTNDGNVDLTDAKGKDLNACHLLWSRLTDYLRSKGYDCGHGSIPSLIAAGVAVEKTNL